MYKKYVYVNQEVRARLLRETGMSEAGLWKALNYETNGAQSIQARDLAIEYGGENRCDLPECETIHDKEGRMIQTFANGAVIICDKASGNIQVEYNGEVVASYPNARISTIAQAQAMASGL